MEKTYAIMYNKTIDDIYMLGANHTKSTDTEN